VWEGAGNVGKKLKHTHPGSVPGNVMMMGVLEHGNHDGQRITHSGVHAKEFALDVALESEMAGGIIIPDRNAVFYRKVIRTKEDLFERGTGDH
jgi:hypothetical protein